MQRPKIITLTSPSIDGRVALGPNRTQWDEMADPRNQLSAANPAVWTEVVEELDAIHKPQVKMQGSSSFVLEGQALEPLPEFTGDPQTLRQDFLPEEVVGNPEQRLWLTVVDGRGRMRSGYKGTETPGNHMLHLTSLSAPPEYLHFLREQSIPYLIAGEGRVDLPAVMGKLQAKLGVETVISEAGGRLNGALLRAGLVDEVNLLVRPELIGGTRTPTLFESPDLEPDQAPLPCELVHNRTLDNGFIWLRYAAAASG